MPSLCRTEPPPRRSTRRFSTRFCRPQRDLASLAGDGTVFASGAREKLEQLRTELDPLARRYDVVVANPPYMGSGNMNKWLGAWVKSQYASTCKDLCTCFISRGMSLALANGYEALITSDTCMYISSFEKMRKEIIDRTTIVAFIDTRGTNAHPDVFDANAGWILWNSTAEEFEGSYFKLNQPIADKEARLLEALADPECGWFYRANASNFEAISGSPIAYWTSRSTIAAFSGNPSLASVSSPRQGLVTGDNNAFLRLWWEVSISKTNYSCSSREESVLSGDKWFPCNKGGGFRRWYGFHEYLIDWENDGRKLRNFFDKEGKLRSRPQNIEYCFKSGCTWGTISTALLSMRYSPGGFISEHAGSMIYSSEDKNLDAFILGFTNSSIASSFLSILSPTLRFTEGPVGLLPLSYQPDMRISKLVDDCVCLTKKDWDAFEESWNYRRHPLV